MSMLGCSKNEEIKNFEYNIRREETFRKNLDHIRNIDYKPKIKFEITEAERKKIAKYYIKSKMKNTYYNVKGWVKNRMDDLSKCIWGS